MMYVILNEKGNNAVSFADNKHLALADLSAKNNREVKWKEVRRVTFREVIETLGW